MEVVEAMSIADTLSDASGDIRERIAAGELDEWFLPDVDRLLASIDALRERLDAASLGAVVVSDTGEIRLRGERVSHREAIELALALAEAVQSSIHRNQWSEPGFRTSEAILERAQTNLGQAIAALRKVYP